MKKISFKHQLIWSILRPPVRLFLWIRFGYTSGTAKNLPEKYIVLSNHVTDYDPLFVGVSFPRQMYLVASEHIGRWGFTYKLLQFAFGPILRKKGMSAASAILDILRKVRAGANVCMFAEGIRTWDGVTCPIAETTGQLVKRAGCGLVTYRLKGGYFVSPGWSRGMRRGWIRGDIEHIYTPDELAAMSVDQINEVIRRDLHEDAYARQLESPKAYKCREPAKGFDNLLYICPWCGKWDTVRASGDRIECTECGGSATLDAFGMIDGMPHRTVTALAAWQREETRRAAEAGGSVRSENGVLWRVDGEAELVTSGETVMTGETFTCGEFTAPIADITDMNIHGRDALVFSVGKDYYELIPEDGSILRFRQFYEAIKVKTEV